MRIYDGDRDELLIFADLHRGEACLRGLEYDGYRRGDLLATWNPIALAIQKAETPYRAAAFLSDTGTVYETGAFHDVEAVPRGATVAAEGFVDRQGRFHSRAEVTEILHADHEIQSEELSLKKSGYYSQKLADFLLKNGFSQSFSVPEIQSQLQGVNDTLESMANPETDALWTIVTELAGHGPRPELAAEAKQRYGRDEVRQALAAHGLDPEDEALRLRIQGRLATMDLSKSEFSVAVIPRAVEPGQPRAAEMAARITRAFASNLVYDVKLGGKHSTGTAVAYDQEANRFWLLKPGSGKLSPGQGIRELPISQARREVAFSQAARQMTVIKDFYPEAYLLLLDGHEVACLEVMGSGFRPAQKLGHDHEMMEPHRQDLNIYRWACVDWCLGNVDRHGGNVLMTADGRLALIDHGSTLAGPSFDPGNDRKSFIPYYLRVAGPSGGDGSDWKLIDAEERLALMPHCTTRESESLRTWWRQQGLLWLGALEDLAPSAVEACRKRYQDLLDSPDFVEGLLGFWAGVR